MTFKTVEFVYTVLLYTDIPQTAVDALIRVMQNAFVVSSSQNLEFL